MSKLKILTIDGPSASGKGSLSRNIAKHLGFKILDSGLLYRTYAYFSQLGPNIEEISNRIKNEISLSFNENDVSILHKDKDITSLLRSETTAKIASQLSALPKTREDLLTIQRDFYNQEGLVADGRDMGTVVFPKATLKIFLTASPEVRAKRRHLELQKRGQEVNMLDLIADIELRDMKDRTRTLSPLIPAEDSVVIDSSNMSIDEVLSFTKKLTKKEFNK
ncbi:(d)CMP kinase [Gammaproteobacteria bacterium]|nr:(d)CMP kinase [Gammaproteobacteria bacterium]MDA9101821.1 (d)CMP kinase [Gammaproteobacteria bacterium]